MNRLAKAGLTLGGAALAAGGLKRALSTRPRYAPWERPRYEDFEHRVLILGGGFAGYNAAKQICEMTRNREDVGVMLIARDNYLTFWPLVAGVVSSDVGVRNTAQPLRRPLIDAGASFRRAEVEGVDFERRIVRADGHEFPYDQLVLAMGAQPSFFGITGVEEHAIPMKGILDAVTIRNRVIERFEEATLEAGDVPESRLTFVVIGAGATGVETAAQLHVLIHDVLGPEYPGVSPNRFRIFLLDGLPDILPELDPGLRRVARGQLVSRDIEVLTEALAEEVTASCVKLKGGREIASENVVWTAGSRPNSKLADLDIPLVEKTNGAKVDRCFRVEGYDSVWAIGDNATIPDGEGGFLPPNAQAAGKEGGHLARNVLAQIDGGGGRAVPLQAPGPAHRPGEPFRRQRGVRGEVQRGAGVPVLARGVPGEAPEPPEPRPAGVRLGARILLPPDGGPDPEPPRPPGSGEPGRKPIDTPSARTRSRRGGARPWYR